MQVYFGQNKRGEDSPEKKHKDNYGKVVGCKKRGRHRLTP